LAELYEQIKNNAAGAPPGIDQTRRSRLDHPLIPGRCGKLMVTTGSDRSDADALFSPPLI
jgi:hypothetical protein